MASSSSSTYPRPRAPSLLQPGEHYDDTGRLCAPPSTVNSRDFYVREEGAGRAAGVVGGSGGMMGGDVQAGGSRIVSNGGRRGPAPKESKPLPLVVRYLPLDIWFCTTIMTDSSVSVHEFLPSRAQPRSFSALLLPSFLPSPSFLSYLLSRPFPGWSFRSYLSPSNQLPLNHIIPFLILL